MTELAPLSRTLIENAMRSAMNRLSEVTRDYMGCRDEAGYAEAQFKIAFAKARMEARTSGGKVTQDMADDAATVATAEQRIEMEQANAKADALRQHLNTIRANLEGFRSLMATYRDVGA